MSDAQVPESAQVAHRWWVCRWCAHSDSFIGTATEETAAAIKHEAACPMNPHNAHDHASRPHTHMENTLTTFEPSTAQPGAQVEAQPRRRAVLAAVRTALAVATVALGTGVLMLSPAEPVVSYGAIRAGVILLAAWTAAVVLVDLLALVRRYAPARFAAWASLLPRGFGRSLVERLVVVFPFVLLPVWLIAVPPTGPTATAEQIGTLRSMLLVVGTGLAAAIAFEGRRLRKDRVGE